MATPVIFSWSAGKDSAMGLWTILQDPGLEVRALVTTLTDTYDRVSISGVRQELLDDQAARLCLPLVKVWIPPDCPNALYEERLALALQREALRDIRHLAFGDLYLTHVRRHREERLADLGRVALFPLWGRDTSDLANEVISAGFRASVVCVDRRVMPTSFAGRSFDSSFQADLPTGVDPCGENGEFHTFVWDAPMYSSPVDCRTGDVVTRGDFDYCDVLPGR
ncbi:MAG: ATP-binding protein, partial [Candidatus Dormiibacterota bacterium]